MKSLVLVASLLVGTLAAADNYKPQQGKMKNCPSSVDRASTVVKNTSDGVELTVTAPSATGATEVQKRAKHMADVSNAGAPHATPDGNGHGGGDHGHCPVVVKGTKATVSDVKNGAKVTLKPRNPAELKQLQDAVAARVAKR